MKDIKHLGLTYQGRLITSVIADADARRAQITPGFVQINCRGTTGVDNSTGLQIPVSQWHQIQREGAK